MNFGSHGRLSDFVLGLSNCLGGAGALVSQAPFGVLVHAVGWRWGFRVLAVIPGVLAVLALLLIRVPPSYTIYIHVYAHTGCTH